MIDTHAHLDGPEYNDDRAEMIQRAKDAGVSKVFIPAIDLRSVQTVTDTCRQFPGYAYPMIGLHPEEVKADYREVLAQMKQQLADSLAANQTPPLGRSGGGQLPSVRPEGGFALLPSARWASTIIGAVSLKKSSWKPLKNRYAGASRPACR